MLLAIDTAMPACSAALWADGGVLAHRFEARASGHAEALMPMIADVLADANAAFSGLTRLACAIGPGSFTGVRTGLAAARGLALALDLPLTGVNTLEAMAEAARARGERGRVAVLHDARRDEFYAQLFDLDDELRPLGAPLLLPAAECEAWLGAGPLILCGSGAGLAAAASNRRIITDIVLPDAVFVAALAARRPALAEPPAALYLRAPDAKLPDPARYKLPA